MFRRVKASPVLTARDVERLSLPGKHIELVRGQLVVREPPGTVFAQDTGFKITSEPDTRPARRSCGWSIRSEVERGRPSCFILEDDRQSLVGAAVDAGPKVHRSVPTEIVVLVAPV